MALSLGVVYVAYGHNARAEAMESIRTLREHHDWPIAVVGDPLPDTQHIPWEGFGRPGRWAKVNLLELSPFERTLYLDADTRVHGDLSIGFDILQDGWELVMVPSKRGELEAAGILVERERHATMAELGDRWPLMLNTGVMWFRRTPRTTRLWQTWREEWQRFQEHDQGALLRAMGRCPVSLWLLGRAFNGGEVVEHLFGRARA